MMQLRNGLAIAISLGTLVLTGCGGHADDTAGPASNVSVADYVVPRVPNCSAGDTPETALQGQVPAALRQSGFGGFNCNLKRVSQLQGEGASWSAATYTDKQGQTCFYHATMGASPLFTNPAAPPRVNPGVPVINITDPANPVRVSSLTSTAMIDPWESLRVNVARGILAGDNGLGGGGGPELDLYDIATDCTRPQLLASVPVGTGADGGIVPTTSPLGHEGGFSPDGLTYYIGSPGAKSYYAIDLTVPTRPKLISTISISNLGFGSIPHGLSVSQDGTRAYFVAIGNGGTAAGTGAPPLNNMNSNGDNGFFVIDTSQVQSRLPNAQMQRIATVPVRDGSVAQHTIPFSVGGKPYLVEVDEGGSGGLQDAGATAVKAACNAGMTPFPLGHIYDMSNETAPRLVSELRLETHAVENCSKVIPDIQGLATFTYGSHYCSVDNRENATALACSYFNSGVRVFDIRDPSKPKEIAYYNPPSVQSPGAGSGHLMLGQYRAGGPDWCASRLDFDFDRHLLTTACEDNGLLVLSFENGSWPFPESTKATEIGN
ncbi:LVIVD repeat-containing protein [Paraburkholderia caffeinilytica]|uniref:LVIVD repeat-containing protein n=1 Tax=Paraburkholderia caffeinilytica TaxID=1761016 RepID=UPI0038B9F009